MTLVTEELNLPGVSPAAVERVGLALEQCPFIGTQDLADFVGYKRTAASSALLALETAGLAERASLGWLRRRMSRWYLTPEGVARFHREGWGSWNEEWALARILERLPLAEWFYPAAWQLGLALGAPVRFQWIQRKAVDACVDYDRGWACFFWSGKGDVEQRLAARLSRFQEEMPGLAALGERAWPSLVVVVAADCWQTEAALGALRSFGLVEAAGVFCCAHGVYEYLGRALPRSGWVYQALARPGADRWGFQQRVSDCLWSEEDSLGAGRLLAAIFEWPGADRALCRAALGIDSRSRQVRLYLGLLEARGFIEKAVARRRERYVAAGSGLNVVSLLDRCNVKLNEKRTQGLSWLVPRIQAHEEGLMNLMAQFMAAGMPTAAGWRYWEHLSGRGGLAPDGLVWLESSLYGPGWHFVEYERSARSEYRVGQKLWSYGLRERRNRWPVLVVCWDEAAERVFWKVGQERSVPILTVPLDRLKEHGALGREAWLCYGKPALLTAAPRPEVN